MIIKQQELDALVNAQHGHPHDVLGLRKASVDGRQGLAGWILAQNVCKCHLVEISADGTETRHQMGRIHECGLFECFIADRTEPFRYRIHVELDNGEIHEYYDPYSFLPTLSDDDVYYINQGNHHHVHQKLGAHPRTVNGIPGYAFAVWAPNAAAVSVTGSFNKWDARYHPMRPLGQSGIWELFIPGLRDGEKYKFRIRTRQGHELLKTDPYGTFFEAPPYNSAITCNVDTDSYKWGDAEWLKKRAGTDFGKAHVSIYEVHFSSWKRVVEDGNRPFTYREMAIELRDYVLEMGFTHVEFLPLMEHPFDGSWGYQVTGFFAPTHRYGTPEDFKFLVDTLHQANIGILLDWVPAHFPRDAFALAEFDGTHLFEHADPRKGAHMDWGTLIFNYGRHEVKNFLIGSALSWFDRYHIDGLRVDAVASMLYLDYSRKEGEWIPNQYGGRENIEAIDFLRQANDLVHQYHPGALMIAEESTAFGGVTKPTSEWGLGFDLKWNMGWMHDTLQYMKKEPIHRKYHHNELTFGMLYQYSEKFTLVFSHDEVVHGKSSMIIKMGGGHEMFRKAADLRCLYALMWAWPGKKTLFMGSEFGQSEEWRYDQSIQWHLLQYLDHSGIQLLIRDLNHWIAQNPAISELDNTPEGFEWVNGGDYERSILSLLRFGNKPAETFLIVVNFTPVPRDVTRFGVPHAGIWKEVLNTNAQCYGGTGHGNFGAVHSEPELWDGREDSIEINLPGHTAIFFQYAGPETPKKSTKKITTSSDQTS